MFGVHQRPHADRCDVPRVIAVTCLPSSSSSFTTSRPTFPVAPVTKIRAGLPFRVRCTGYR